MAQIAPLVAADVEGRARDGRHGNAVDPADLIVSDAFAARDDACGRTGMRVLVNELDRRISIDPLRAMDRRGCDARDDCPPLGP